MSRLSTPDGVSRMARRSLEKQLGALRATIPRRMSLKDIHAAIEGGRP